MLLRAASMLKLARGGMRRRLTSMPAKATAMRARTIATRRATRYPRDIERASVRSLRTLATSRKLRLACDAMARQFEGARHADLRCYEAAAGLLHRRRNYLRTVPI
jgi:hypothetical protein